jgi:hypothetical protein
MAPGLAAVLFWGAGIAPDPAGRAMTALAAEHDSPTAREERERRWYEERRERQRERDIQRRREDTIRERRERTDSERERDWDTRRRGLETLPEPPPAERRDHQE